jgi:hypothetical protein
VSVSNITVNVVTSITIHYCISLNCLIDTCIQYCIDIEMAIGPIKPATFLIADKMIYPWEEYSVWILPIN